MLEDAVRYPAEGEDATRTIVIGGILTLFGFLFVPILIVYGYVLEAFRSVLAGDTDEPPTFDDWGDLLVDGLKAFVVLFVYGIVPGAILFLTAGSAALAAATGGDAAGLFGGLVATLGFLLAVLLGLLVWYVLPAALAGLATDDRLGAAFDISEIRAVVLDGDYAVGWLIGLGILIGVGIVAGAVAIVPVVGWLAAPFLYFYGLVAAFYVYGRAVADATGPGGSEGAVDEQPAV